MSRIYSQRHNSLNEEDRLELARLLVKAGYVVRLGRERPAGNTTGAFKYYVEYWEEDERE